MFLVDSIFVGIDPTSGRNAFTYAALDKDLNLLALSDGGIDDLELFLTGQNTAVVAVNSPSGVNKGLVRKKIVREMISPHQVRGVEMRLGEFELREHGIVVAGTPASAANCPAWIQLGFEIYKKLEILGFKKYPQKNSPHQYMEIHPHASFCVLAEKIPLSKPSLEGRLQRHLILFEQGIRISDPMEFFEETTRYKIARGIWPMELLYLPEQLDALIAAFTAFLAATRPEKVMVVGDAKEGNIVLPATELMEWYEPAIN
jgi:hypothetical protein